MDSSDILAHFALREGLPARSFLQEQVEASGIDIIASFWLRELFSLTEDLRVGQHGER